MSAERLVALTKKALKDNYRDLTVQRDSNGKVVKLIINQSLITTIFYHTNHYYSSEISDYCPKKLNEVFMKGNGIISNIHMLRGIYFEERVLKNYERSKPTELPLTRSGKKSAAQERIDQQIESFDQLCEQNGIIVTDKNTQISQLVRIEDYGDVEVYVKIKIDLISPIVYNKIEIPAAIIDIKLTGDLEHGRFGKYVDTTQAHLYSLITNLPFFYWVFDYSPSLRNDIIRVITFPYHMPQEKNEAITKKLELQEKIRLTVKTILEHEEFGYPANANKRECMLCPLNPDHGGNCQQASSIKTIS